MTERLLHFIWQFQYFNPSDLCSSSGEKLKVISPGQYNTNQGPDFLHAKIRIQQATWAGQVELHVKSSDWEKHRHQFDKNYDNVILHVVWEDDRPATDQAPGQKTIPVLELKGRVPGILLQRYRELMDTTAFIPCEKMILGIRELSWRSWKDRLLAERLTRKAEIVYQFLGENKFHWEESFWWLLARHFGMKVNADAFEAIARTLPLKILARHRTQPRQLEALLLGQAGLLSRTFSDEYARYLQQEYKFLQGKYKLKPIHLPVHFLRMRPGNFPTIRLAQLAALIAGSAQLFSRVKETASLKEILKLVDVSPGEYWIDHYRLDELSAPRKKSTGSAMTAHILINTIAPVLFAWGQYHKEYSYRDRVLKWLEQTEAEQNSITKGFERLGVENKNAADSQALTELKNEYCRRKKCLECAVGNALLKS